VGVSLSNSAGASVQVIFVIFLSNLIYLAFRELVSLDVGCLTACSRGSHHLVSESGFITQLYPSKIFVSCFHKKFLSVQFLLLLEFAAYKKNLFHFVTVQNISVV